MNRTEAANLRCVALVGHGAVGKTTLAEALLHASGAIAVRGTVEKGNTVCDFDAQEKAWGHSLHSALVALACQEVRVHLIDTPGYPDFSGEAIGALAGVDTALVVVSAQTGIEPVTEYMMQLAADRGLCRMIIVNKIDADNLDLAQRVTELRARFGRACMVLDLPMHDRTEVVELLEHASGASDFDSVAAAHRALIDQIVEEDETLLARYLEDGTDPTPGELHAPFEKALREGHLIPIVFVSARTGAGVPQLLDVLAHLAPSPAEGNAPPFYRGEPGSAAAQPFRAVPDPEQHVLAHVFKVISDPFIGKLGVFRVHQGTVRRDTQLFVGDGRKPFKVHHLYRLQGKDYLDADALGPGEIGAIAKVEEIALDCVLHDSHDEDRIHLRPIDFPLPMQGLAVETLRKADEQRLFEVLQRLEVEDPCFRVERHPHSNETVIRGLGEMHLRSKLERMAQQYKLELSTRPPAIAYRETVSAVAQGHCRHKKQSGGAGQFGEVALRVEPLERGAGFEFVDVVKGGAIPGVFMPAVEKGVRQALDEGVIAGFALQDVRVTVLDGKSHAVDSKEVAFIAAGRKATIAAVRSAQPVVLEPVVEVEIISPLDCVGDLTGDLAGKRAQVTATETRDDDRMLVRARVPLAELDDYQSRLKSITGGQGSYRLQFSHYAQVPMSVQQQLVARHAPAHRDED